MEKVKWNHSVVSLLATPWTAAYQAPLSMGSLRVTRLSDFISLSPLTGIAFNQGCNDLYLVKARGHTTSVSYWPLISISHWPTTFSDLIATHSLCPFCSLSLPTSPSKIWNVPGLSWFHPFSWFQILFIYRGGSDSCLWYWFLEL